MSEDSPEYSKIAQAKTKLERAFRVQFDREPLSEQEQTLVQMAAERIASTGEQAT